MQNTGIYSELGVRCLVYYIFMRQNKFKKKKTTQNVAFGFEPNVAHHQATETAASAAAAHRGICSLIAVCAIRRSSYGASSA